MRRKREQRVTIQDIAQAAQVSPTTVSLVLNRKGNINENTRTKVWKIAEEMNFVPNSIARALRGGRTFSLGVVVNHLRNNFFTSVFSGIERVTDALGYTILVSQTHDDVNKERSQVQLLTERGVDGLILFPCSQEWSHVDTVVQRFGLPTVLIGNYFEEKEYLSFGCRQLERRLQGGAAPYLLGAPTDPPHGRPRRFRPCASFGGAPLNRPCPRTFRRYLPGSGSFRSRPSRRPKGTASWGRYWSTHRPPLSLFVINDDTALGVLRLCADRGLRIPEDVAPDRVSATSRR